VQFFELGCLIPTLDVFDGWVRRRKYFLMGIDSCSCGHGSLWRFLTEPSRAENREDISDGFNSIADHNFPPVRALPLQHQRPETSIGRLGWEEPLVRTGRGLRMEISRPNLIHTDPG
jgi:hypothetical protein